MLLTVPASFDAVARELTVEAARAGRPARTSRCSRSRRPRSTPGSARAGDALAQAARASATSCWSCDVGGGTTDFIADRRRRGATATSRSSASPSATTSCSAATTWTWRSPTRVRAQARARRARSSTPGSCASLAHACRAAKEQLLADAELAKRAGRGPRPRPQGDRRHDARPSSTRADVERAARRRLLPRVRAGDARRSAPRASACSELGLPYAADAGDHAPPRRRSSARHGAQRRPRSCSTAAS